MDFVITCVPGRNDECLTQAFADSMTRALAGQGVVVRQAEILGGGAACDLLIVAENGENLDSCVRDILGDTPYDAVVQSVSGRGKKLLIADMDSTMITVECIDELADFVGKKAEVAAITERAMNGELHFEAALAERVALLKGLPESTLQQCYDERVRLMPGARELLAAHRKAGGYSVLVSGGFTFFTSRVAAALGFDENHANQLEVASGQLTGRVIMPILGKEAKLQTLKNACARLHIIPQEVLAVGDGANDLPMLLAAGLGVAYHAKPTVRAQARARIDHGDLSALIWVLGYKRDQAYGIRD